MFIATSSGAIRAATRLSYAIMISGTSVLAALTAEAYDYGDPTPAEQYALEKVNWIRANPDAAAAAYGISLNEALTAGTITSAPKTPLVMESSILNISRAHAQDLLDRNYWAHNTLGTNVTPSGRATAAGYAWSSYGENLNANSVTPTTSADQVQVDAALKNLFVDSQVPNRGHRIAMMSENKSESGVGFRQGTGWTAAGAVFANYPTKIFCQDFAAPLTPRTFVTGVCYSDNNGNGQYDIGEGMSNVTITTQAAVSPNPLVNTLAPKSTMSRSAGGYALEGTGAVNITAVGPDLNITKSITVSGKNMKLDFKKGEIQNLPAIVGPVPNGMLPGAAVTFQMAANGISGISNWYIYAGTTQGNWNLGYGGSATPAVTISGLPLDGSTVWVRMWYYVGGYWRYRDFQYTASRGPSPLQNKTNNLDVNNDGYVSPIDALLVINRLNSTASKAVTPADSGPPYLDVNGDWIISPIDALLVINKLNTR